MLHKTAWVSMRALIQPILFSLSDSTGGTGLNDYRQAHVTLSWGQKPLQSYL